MSIERRFLVAPSFARLIQRDKGTLGRIVEGHFAPQSDRRLLVRVGQSCSAMVLLNRAGDGDGAEASVEIPLTQARALIEVAAGTVAFDRTDLPLGGDIDAFLDRFIIPDGLDILTVTIPVDPHAFAPLPWFGLEVTGEPAFATLALALKGAPRFEEVKPSNAGLEALLDSLDGRSLYDLRTSTSSVHNEEKPALPTLSGIAVTEGQAKSAAGPGKTSGSGSDASVADDAEEEFINGRQLRRLAGFLRPRNPGIRQPLSR